MPGRPASWRLGACLALLLFAGVASPASQGAANDRVEAASPVDSNAVIVWGTTVRFSTKPLPSRRLVVTQNVLLLDNDLPSPGIVENKNLRVRCDVYYTRGWGKVVRRLTLPGTWRPPHLAEKDYGGQLTGQVRCGPMTVWKKSLGLWLGINPRVTYEGTVFDRTKGRGVKGTMIRKQISRASVPRSPEPVDTEPISFLPQVGAGTIYPALGPVHFGATLTSVWQAFARPPETTCTDDTCSWANSIDRFYLQLATPYDSAEQAERRFDRVLLSSKHPSVSQLSGWQTPEGIHIGSTALEVLNAYPEADCVGRRCNISPALGALAGTRYRFLLAISLDDDASSADALVESIDVTQLGAEGTCRPSVSFREQGIPDSTTTFFFVARCGGKLRSARLEALDGSTLLYEAPTNERTRLDPTLYTNAGAAAPNALGYRSLSDIAFADVAYTWQIGCESPDPAEASECAPSRGPGAPAWSPELYEDWELVFRGTTSVPSIVQDGAELIAPLRFVAEFADRPPFTYILREAY